MGTQIDYKIDVEKYINSKNGIDDKTGTYIRYTLLVEL